MDWSRTKTILIMALLLTNAILFFVLYGDRLGVDDIEEIEQTQLKGVIQLLKSEEIYLVSEVSGHDQYLSDIRLTYETYEDENIVKILLGDVYSKVEDRYLSKDAEIRILGTKDLIYKRLNVMGGVVETDIDKAELLATEFLETKGLMDSSVSYWTKSMQDNGSVMVEFRQVENGNFVESAYMTMTVSGDEITELKRKWFGSIQIEDTIKHIESPAKALFRLLPEIDSSNTIERPVKIVSMDLGYRLVSNILTINFQEGEPSPYWRFMTSSGEVIYIEAQTEE